eukprot:gene3011-biopygen2950
MWQAILWPDDGARGLSGGGARRGIVPVYKETPGGCLSAPTWLLAVVYKETPGGCLSAPTWLLAVVYKETPGGCLSAPTWLLAVVYKETPGGCLSAPTWLLAVGLEGGPRRGDVWCISDVSVMAQMTSPQPGEDLGLDMHTDDSDVTYNVCLGKEFEGAGLTFCGALRFLCCARPRQRFQLNLAAAHRAAGARGEGIVSGMFNRRSVPFGGEGRCQSMLLGLGTPQTRNAEIQWLPT